MTIKWYVECPWCGERVEVTPKRLETALKQRTNILCPTCVQEPDAENEILAYDQNAIVVDHLTIELEAPPQ
jgi:phage terminase large subunit GpA-like protein